ncbi:MAG: ABC transporter ATP-binding protein, partial [Desulfatiglandales bacterium]
MGRLMRLLEVRDLALEYRTKKGPFLALEDIHFHVEKGEVLAFVGESGCGKTTVGMSILRLLPENAHILKGEILFEGRDILRLSQEELRRYRWKEVSMIFQAAMNSLNPVKRVGDQIKEAIQTHEPDISKGELKGRVEALFRLVNLPLSRIGDYPHQYSGGMRQRAVIAMALALRPKLIIADEATTALDVIVQDQILKETRLLQKEFGLSFIFISHDIALAFEVADRVAVMYGGRIVELGSSHDLEESPTHPYTMALLDSYPTLTVERR